MLADMETVTKRLEKARHLLKNGDKKYAEEVEAANIVLEHLNGLKPARTAPLDEDQLALYAAYMGTLGNRDDLFPDSPYVARYSSGYGDYDIPEALLDDARFAAIITEAEKYLGYPYVWGGSSPATSFDCSGFVSWVLNHSGWNVGRLTTDGLYALCTPIPSAYARPGDLVFFRGTYDTPGISHVGIYVGNDVMLHCGDPISYTHLSASYWQQHFAGYGRLP